MLRPQYVREGVYRFAIDAPTRTIQRRNTLIKYHHKVPETANVGRGSEDANWPIRREKGKSMTNTKNHFHPPSTVLILKATTKQRIRCNVGKMSNGIVGRN